MLKQPTAYNPIDPLNIGYATPFNFVPSTSNTVSVANRAHYYKLISGCNINVLRYQQSTSSGNYDIGIYDNVPGTIGYLARPGNRLWSLGSTPTPAAGKVDLTVTPEIIALPGQHWFAFTADNVTALFRAQASVVGLDRGNIAAQAAGFPLPAVASIDTTYSLSAVPIQVEGYPS